MVNVTTSSMAAGDGMFEFAPGAGPIDRRDDFDRDVWCLAGLPVDAADINRAVAEIDRAARTGRKLSFVTPNVNWLVRAARDPETRRQIVDADMSLIDGAPLVVMARLLGVPVTSRVAGSDVFDALRRRPGFGGRRLKVFFFGGQDGAGVAAVEALNREAGGLEAVGALNPGFGDVEAMSADAIIDEINAAAPDFVVVALGAAKGQAWIDRNKDRLTAPVISHLGAVIDFAAGRIERAPAMVQKLGLEWAWRIKEEPALWRRYFEDALGLLSIVLGRLAPQMGMGRASPSSAGRAELTQGADRAIVRLTGDFSRGGGLASVRSAFRHAAARGGDVVLDCTNLNHFDRSFLGLVLMLEKHVVKAGRTLYLSGATPSQMRAFRANAMAYPAAPAERESASREAANQ